MSEWSSIISRASEDRNREYKTSFPWERTTDGETMAKVTKTILAMSNLRDGGHIAIGVDEDKSGCFSPKGMQQADVATYSFDEVADFVRNYAEPYARFGLDIVEEQGKMFVVMSVAGFDEVPVICRKSYGDILHEGLVYVRPQSGRPRSEPVAAYIDMRELMDLAAEKRLRRYVEMISVASSPTSEDAGRFEKQLEGFGL